MEKPQQICQTTHHNVPSIHISVHSCGMGRSYGYFAKLLFSVTTAILGIIFKGAIKGHENITFSHKCTYFRLKIFMIIFVVQCRR
jgi:hypothetical protein